MHNFRGDLTDISAKSKPLVTATSQQPGIGSQVFPEIKCNTLFGYFDLKNALLDNKNTLFSG